MVIGLEELDPEYQYNVLCMDKKTRAMHYFKKVFPLGDLCRKLKDLATQEYVVFGENALDTRCWIDSKPAICYFYYFPILDKRCNAEFQKKLNNRFPNEE